MFNKKRKQFEKALNSLLEVLLEEKNDFIRDSMIQRFEYTSELFWKTLKEYLLAQEKIEALFPKAIMRECRNVGLLSDEETEYALTIIDDRNLSSHAYNEKLAGEISERIPRHADFMKAVYQRILDRCRK